MPGTGGVGVLSQGAKSRSSSFRQMTLQHLDNISVNFNNNIGNNSVRADAPTTPRQR